MSFFFRRPTTRHLLYRVLFNQELIMAAQADLDARTAAILDLASRINANVDIVKAAIASQPEVDLTGLDAAVAALGDASAALDAVAHPAA